MRPGDRIIVAFTQNRAAGDTFKDWLLHITIVPWLRLEMPDGKLANKLEEQLAGIAGFTVRVGGDARFGRRGKTVSLVELPSPLEEIERRVRQFLKANNAWLVDETTRRRGPYRPHVTEQKAGRLYAGDRFECDVLYVVTQRGEYKEVTGEVTLND